MKQYSPAFSRALRLHPTALAAVGFVAHLAAAHGQEGLSNAAADVEQPTVTVSASGLGLKASDMATPVTVLEGDAWALRQSSTIGESLRAELGMHATHFGAGASRPIIRGMDGPRVAVLSNGMALHDASTISPDHAVTVDPFLAEHVEILRGPSALAYGGAVGGVVNVVDQKIPTEVPSQGVEGSAQLRWGSAANAKNAAMGLTAGQGPWVLRVEAAGHQADDYRVGHGWQAGQGASKVNASATEGNTGTIGLSWVVPQAYVGAAYTRQKANYGLPGHTHSDCHPHGSHLHCGGHHAHADHHDDEDAHSHGSPVVDMTSHRWDVRGQWLQPVRGIEAVRFKGSHTRYGHDEIEGAHVATEFRNRAHDFQIELQHAPVAGWRGTVGWQQGQRNFSAQGEEAYLQPTRTLQHSLFVLQEYQWQQVRWQAAWRWDQQQVHAMTAGQTRKHHGQSASLGAVWSFAPGWQATASASHAVRLPSAQELFANGLHMATNSWEVGNSHLGKERSNALEAGLRKTAGATTWSANLYHHRIQNYIYGRTVDAHDGFLLQHYSQADARFTGLEAQVRQRLSHHWHVGLFGDVVRARLAQGGHLPRIPAARWGVRAQANYGGWTAQAEWVQVARQSRTAAWETATGGYGMLNAAAFYRWSGSPLELMVKAENLNNRLAYAHTSAVKHAAPLQGRNITLGVRVQY